MVYALIFLIPFHYGWVATFLWNRYVVPLGPEPIFYLHAVGLILCVGAFICPFKYFSVNVFEEDCEN